MQKLVNIVYWIKLLTELALFTFGQGYGLYMTSLTSVKASKKPINVQKKCQILFLVNFNQAVGTELIHLSKSYTRFNYI